MKAIKHGARYQITYRCPTYPKLINEVFSTEEAANLRIAQIQLERKLGTLKPPARVLDPDRDRELYRETITVVQLMQEYITLYGMSHWAEGTLSCNVHRINDYVIPYIGNVPIKELTTHKLELFYQKLRSEPAVKMKGRENEDNTISLSVIEKVHALIRNALNQAIRWDYLRGSNPAMTVELPRQKSRQRDAWTDQEARIALELCDDADLKLCMLLALGCSMRIGEILGLTWDCVHMEDELLEKGSACVHIEKELRRSSKKSVASLREHGRDDIFFVFPEVKTSGSTTMLVLKTPKTESSVRNVFLPDTVAAGLKAAKEKQEKLKRELGAEYQDFNLVVAQANGRPFEERLIAKKLKALIDTNSLRPVVFHSLRHCSTSVKLKLSGGNIKAVQGDTGHAQANMVTDVYAHIMTDDRQNLAHLMDTKFFSASVQLPVPSASKPEPVRQLLSVLDETPDMAGLLLQMMQMMGKAPARA